MPCALEVIDARLQSTSHIQCNRSFDQNIGKRFSKGHLIPKPVAVCPENSDTSSATLPLGHDLYWKQAPFLSDTQEANKVISSSGALGTECLELLSAQPRILCCLGQPNERNMHDQVDSSKRVSNGNTHGASTLRQPRQRKNVCNSSTTVPPCHVVAKYSSPVATTLGLRSDSGILHNDDKLSKRNTKKRAKQCKRTIRKRLNLASETTFEESTCGASPVEVVPTNLLVDKLSETTPSASLLVKNDGQYKDYVECGIMLNLPTLGTDEMDGSGCAGSSYNVAGGRLSSGRAPYLSDESNMIDSSEFDGSTFTEHGLGRESNSYQKSTGAYVYNPSHATTDSIFSKWNNENSGNYIGVEATIKDENGHDHSKPGSSTGLSNMRAECQLIGSHLSATHAEDTNDHLGVRSYSKDVTDSCSHTERVQCSSQACSSKASLQVSSGRRNIKSSKTPSYIDLTASNRARGSNRHKNNGKDSSAVWQKVERNDKMISKSGHLSNSPIHDKGAYEVGKKGVQEDPTKIRAKCNQNRKVCKQDSSNGTVELEPTKEEDALNSCHTFSGPVYKKQAPFLRQQKSSNSKQGSQSLKNYYAPRIGIPKVPKDYSQQEELPMLVLVHAKNTSDRPTSYSSSADEVCLTGVGSNYPTEGNEGSQPGVEIATSVSCNSVPDLAPQAASDDSHVSDPHSLCPESKGVSTSGSSKNLCTDPFAAETKEAPCVKLLTENNSQECCKWYSAAGQLSQKWVPVGKKETCNGICLDVSANGEDRNLPGERTCKLNSSEHVDLKSQADNATEADYSKMKEAISYVYTAQQKVDDIQLRIGRPIAVLENFVHSASPIVHCSPCPAGCKSYLQESVKDGLCFHQAPDITLRTVWQWYEEPSCYGLDVKAQDLRRSKGLWNSHCQFTTYFVPYLSAVQLFSQPRRTSGGSIDKESIHRDVTCETSPDLNLPPIFAKLFPKQSNPVSKSSTLRTEDDQQPADGELIFEFFESEQPYSRQQLFDKVNELISGVKPLKCQISGDPKNLEVSLHDLHPASWYCVAWYPVYRIPDGKFQAAFLTYHSLGHWIHQSSSADGAIVLPVVGLQSYNAKAEWWFEMSKSDSEGADSAESQSSEESQILKERLRTLNESAAVMSRASVLKNGQMSRNRHSDFEFFISRS